jgi:crotonobetainyl-CoA:carnitine CoA-transferase CaiB-like acyl-CoA transferase
MIFDLSKKDSDSEAGLPPLAGYRVLDLSRVMAGPWCAMVLGDLGARVIKVEKPGQGDDTRHWGGRLPGGESNYYVSVNRNKRGIAIDISKPEGQEIIRKIAKESDVVIENYKLGSLRKFGLDYEQLSAINPGIIYCSISGYGRSGPNASRLGYDVLIQAESGLMALTGEPQGAPVKVGVAISDMLAGMYAAQGILAAIIARSRTGKGQHIDVALLDCTLASLGTVAVGALYTKKAPGRFGNAHPDVVPYEPYTAADGELILAIGNDAQFRRLCIIAFENPDLAKDPRFQTNRLRLENRVELRRIFLEILKGRTRQQWTERFEEAAVPAGSVQNFLEAVSAKGVRERGIIKSIDHPTAGHLEVVGSPLFMSDTPVISPGPPPLLGQHTDEILTEFGFSTADRSRLRLEGVVA